jgi:hypothetical protein
VSASEGIGLEKLAPPSRCPPAGGSFVQGLQTVMRERGWMPGELDYITDPESREQELEEDS